MFGFLAVSVLLLILALLGMVLVKWHRTRRILGVLLLGFFTFAPFLVGERGLGIYWSYQRLVAFALLSTVVGLAVLNDLVPAGKPFRGLMLLLIFLLLSGGWGFILPAFKGF